MLSELKIGPRVVSDGAQEELRGEKSGALVTSDGHGRYTEACYRGQLFNACNVAAVAVSVGRATTYTGLCLSNRLGNTKNAVILGCQLALTVAPVGVASLHLIAGYSAIANVTHTTPLAAPGIQNGLIGTGPASSMNVDSAATIVNPNYLFPLGSGFTAGALYATEPSWVELAGLFILPPGAWIALGSLTALTGAFGGFVWEEIPI